MRYLKGWSDKQMADFYILIKFANDMDLRRITKLVKIEWQIRELDLMRSKREREKKKEEERRKNDEYINEQSIKMD